MENYSMNIGSQGVEQNRECDDRGFDTHRQDLSVPRRTTIPYEGPLALSDEAVRTSDTTKLEVGPSASDITARTRNG